MNHQFYIVSSILNESTLPAAEKKHLYHLSIKLAWRGVKKLIGDKKDKYHEKKLEKKVQNDANKIYLQLLQQAEERINSPIYEQ